METMTSKEYRAIPTGSTGKFEIYLKLKCDQYKISFIKEYQFCPGRKWRTDYAIPEIKLLFEFEGIGSVKSRHTTIVGYSRDCNKYNMAQLLGYKVIRFTAYHFNKNQIKNTFEFIDKVLTNG